MGAIIQKKKTIFLFKNHTKLSFMYEFSFTEWNFQSVKLISNWPFLCCEVSNILLTVQIIRVSTEHFKNRRKHFSLLFSFHISSYIWKRRKESQIKKFIFFFVLMLYYKMSYITKYLPKLNSFKAKFPWRYGIRMASYFVMCIIIEMMFVI